MHNDYKIHEVFKSINFIKKFSKIILRNLLSVFKISYNQLE
jgi:hypothetical protein